MDRCRAPESGGKFEPCKFLSKLLIAGCQRVGLIGWDLVSGLQGEIQRPLCGRI
jgi:hypothetical protein